MWSKPERELLQGTSLQASTPMSNNGTTVRRSHCDTTDVIKAALSAKLSVLEQEFDELREKSSQLPFWDTLLWEQDGATLDDWILVDAWYRSRCLELPQSGDSMVPVLDMVNHSNEPNAFYEQDNDGNVQLCLRPNTAITQGDEITISYGASKPAAEMLFSYGFIDKQTATNDLTLPVDPFDDDPLAKAKAHIFGRPGVVKLVEEDGVFKWQSPFAFLVCLNEEDGLEFRVLQDTEGNRQLKLFWQDDDVTERAHDIENVISGHPLYQLFKLRVITVVYEQVAKQLEDTKIDISEEQLEPLVEGGLIRQEIVNHTQNLRNLEAHTLEKALEMLETQVRLINATHTPHPPQRPNTRQMPLASGLGTNSCPSIQFNSIQLNSVQC